MSMKTITRLRCICGHEGLIVEGENDQPYSKEWSHTSLRDLNRNGVYSGSNSLFAKMQPSCPKCGRSLSPEHIVP